MKPRVRQKILVFFRSYSHVNSSLCDADARPPALACLLQYPMSTMLVSLDNDHEVMWHDGPLSQFLDQTPQCVFDAHPRLYLREDSSNDCITAEFLYTSHRGEVMPLGGGTYFYPASSLHDQATLTNFYSQVQRAYPNTLPPRDLVSFEFTFNHPRPTTDQVFGDVSGACFHAIALFSALDVRYAHPTDQTPLMAVLDQVPANPCEQCMRASLDENANCAGGVLLFTFDSGTTRQVRFQCPPEHVQLHMQMHDNLPERDSEHDSDNENALVEHNSDSDMGANLQWGDDVEIDGGGFADTARIHDGRRKSTCYQPLAHFQEYMTSLNGTENVVIPQPLLQEIGEYISDRCAPITRAVVRAALGTLESYYRQRYSPYYPNAQRIACILRHGKPSVLPPFAITACHRDTLRFLYSAFHKAWLDLPIELRGTRRILLRGNIVFWVLCEIAARVYNDPTFLEHHALDPQPDGGPPPLKDPRLRDDYIRICHAICTANHWPLIF